MPSATPDPTLGVGALKQITFCQHCRHAIERLVMIVPAADGTCRAEPIPADGGDWQHISTLRPECSP